MVSSVTRTLTTVADNTHADEKYGLWPKGDPIAIAHFSDPEHGIDHTYILHSRDSCIRLIDHNACPRGKISILATLDSWVPLCLFLVPKRYRTPTFHLICGTSRSIFSISQDGEYVILLTSWSKNMLMTRSNHLNKPSFAFANGITINSKGHLLFTNTEYNVICRLFINQEKENQVVIIAGNPESKCSDPDHEDPLMATFANPSGICVDTKDNVFISDEHGIRHMDSQSGAVTTFCDISIVIGSTTSLLLYEPLNIIFAGDLNEILMITVNTREFRIVVEAGSGRKSGIDFEYPQLALKTSDHSRSASMLQSLSHFHYWPPGLLQIVIDYIHGNISLLATDRQKHSLLRVDVDVFFGL